MARQGVIVANRRVRAKRGRRTWNQAKEEALLSNLKELVNTGWKSDNRFRGGYVNKLEDMLRATFPRAEIKGSPHITSKITGWKKNYGSLSYIISRSGVGFNLHGDFKVDCDDAMWENLCLFDANAKNIRGKSLPYYDGWSEVFGKDRTTGAQAEDVIDAVNELINEDNLNHRENVLGEKTDEADDVPDTPETIFGARPSSRLDAAVVRSSWKRKAVDDVDKNLCDLLGQMQKDINSRLEGISTSIRYQADLGKARTEIFALLECVPGLSLDEKFYISDILLDKPERLEFLTSLPEAARLAYAIQLLNRM